MSQSEIEKARHANERGEILRALKQDFTSEMTSVRNLRGALDLLRMPMSIEALEFHLNYLAAQGYIDIWRARDLPRRRDRQESGWVAPDTILFAKLRPKGLQLIDGQTAEDPLVSF